MDGLQQIQEMYNGPVLKLSQAKDVRWLSHDKATQTMKRCLPEVLASLEREAEERHDSQAMGLSVFVRSHKFIACINMMCDVLPHMSAFSKAIQTYKPFMRNLSANLESRFPDLPILENFGVFTAEDMDHNGYGDVEIKALAVHFSLDERYAAMEWSQLRSTICASPSLHTCTADQTMEWVVAHLRESHPNIYSLAVIGLLLPTSTADCERGFSAMNRVKTTHRATLSQKVLNALLAVTMQGPPLPDFNFSQAVEEWHQTKPRRSQLS